MADRKCPFYQYESTGWLSSKETCRRTGADISTTTYNTYCNNWESGYSKCPNFQPDTETSNCYITSACVEAMGRCDCCVELTTIRDFRDNWLAKQPGGQAEIDEYYKIAPNIVGRIKASSECESIFANIYEHMVLPCVKLIQKERFSEAWELYRETTLELKKEFVG